MALMNKSVVYPFSFVLMAIASCAFADAPSFDRPGIAFSTSTLSRGSFSFELGLPDFQHASDGDNKSTLYSMDTNIRAGLGENIELQLATPLFNYLKTKHTGVSDSAFGLGDSSLSLKFALPSASDKFSWAGLAGVTFPTGQDPFTTEKPQYRLANAMSLRLNDTYSTGFYINLTRSNGKTGYTLSPNLNFALTNTVGVYVEAGFNHIDQSPNSAVAGGGLAWIGFLNGLWLKS